MYTAIMDDCIEWTGSVDRDGYGKLEKWHNGKRVQFAHRWAYIQAHGDIPEGMCVRHKCDNRPCINPDHLEVGTHADNMQDRLARGNHPLASATHCKNGHEFTEENTLWSTPKGRNPRRSCRTCNRVRMRKHRTKSADLNPS